MFGVSLIGTFPLHTLKLTHANTHTHTHTHSYSTTSEVESVTLEIARTVNLEACDRRVTKSGLFKNIYVFV